MNKYCFSNFSFNLFTYSFANFKFFKKNICLSILNIYILNIIDSALPLNDVISPKIFSIFES